MLFLLQGCLILYYLIYKIFHQLNNLLEHHLCLFHLCISHGNIFCKFKMSAELLYSSPLVSTNLVITLSMKFLFSKFKEYPNVFSPNCSNLHLDLYMTPSVLTFLISDSAFFLSSNLLISSSVISF